jgi:MFS family permease
VKKTNFRWVIVALLFFATTINYFDRFLMGILAPLLESEIGWSELEYGYIVSSFQLAYAIGTLLAGYIIDRLGTRWGFALAVSLWSIASMMHAAARSWVGFAFARIGLGVSEAGNFPAAIKTVAEWFPKKERALATGLFNGGSNVGAILAPILIPVIISFFGSWEWVFILSGFLGVFWLIFWLILYKKPGENRFTNQAEIDYIEEGETEPEQGEISWVKLLKHRQTWAVALGKLFADPVWYFYLFWGAKFLNSKFGVDLKELALPLVSIYVIADLGGIAGGAISSKLMKNGKSANYARKSHHAGFCTAGTPCNDRTLSFFDVYQRGTHQSCGSSTLLMVRQHLYGSDRSFSQTGRCHSYRFCDNSKHPGRYVDGHFGWLRPQRGRSQRLSNSVCCGFLWLFAGDFGNSPACPKTETYNEVVNEFKRAHSKSP